VSARTVRRAAREVAGELRVRRWPWVATAAAAVAVLVVAATGLAGVWRLPPREAWLGLAARAGDGPPPTVAAALAPPVGAATVEAPAPAPAAPPPPAPATTPEQPAAAPAVAATPSATLLSTAIVPAPAPPAAAPAADLEAVLRSVRPPSDRSAALARVLVRWGVVGSPSDDLCRIATRAELECVDGRGSWTLLRRLGVPAAIKLLAADGTRQWVAVTALEGDAVTLEVRERVQRVPLAAVDRLWDGAFTLIWRPLPGSLRVLAPGAQGPGVVWLRRALGEGDTSRAVYDEALATRVAAFQKREGLEPDGVAGMETLVRLSARVDRRAPLLTAR
jgi:hypothetical protein